jgi:dienelactone hydrolase
MTNPSSAPGSWRRALRQFALTSLAVCVAVSALLARQKVADEWLAKPVDDRTFKTFLDFFAYDRQVPFETRSIDTTEQEGIRKEHLSFQSTAGVRVFANLYESSSADARRMPALVLLHSAAVGGKDARGIDVRAQSLTRAGYRVLSIDMLYWGERSTNLLTTFSEEEKHARLYNQPSMYLSWVAQTVKDVGRAFDFLVEQKKADAKRIGLFGNSRGAIVGAIAGAADRRLAAVVLLNGAHFDALEREHLPAACPANYIGRISPRPLLMLNGLYDQDHVKETSVDPLYRIAREPKLILWSETGHAPPSEKNQAAMYQWLRENLK